MDKWNYSMQKQDVNSDRIIPNYYWDSITIYADGYKLNFNETASGSRGEEQTPEIAN